MEEDYQSEERQVHQVCGANDKEHSTLHYCDMLGSFVSMIAPHTSPYLGGRSGNVNFMHTSTSAVDKYS